MREIGECVEAARAGLRRSERATSGSIGTTATVFEIIELRTALRAIVQAVEALGKRCES